MIKILLTNPSYTVAFTTVGQHLPLFGLPLLFFVYSLNLDGFIQSLSLNTIYMVMIPKINSSPDMP